MSQLLQVHINQRLLKSESGQNSPASPGMINSPVALSPMSVGPSSPQGMPIPRRSAHDTWIVNPSAMLSQGAFPTGNTWSGGGGIMDANVDSPLEMSSGAALHQESDSLHGDSTMMTKLSMAVDEDDIFKVEKSEFLGPTLAELNASDADTLLDGLNFDDLYWPPDSSSFNAVSEATPSSQTGHPLLNMIGTNDPELDLMVVPSSSFPPMGSGKLAVPASSVPVASQSLIEQTILQIPSSSDVVASTSNILTNSNPPTSSVTSRSSSAGLRELLLRRELQNSLESPDVTAASPLGQSLPRSMLTPSPGSLSPRLSSSAPSGANNAWETWQQRREAVWQRRDPRPHLLSTGSLAEGGSTSSLLQGILGG